MLMANMLKDVCGCKVVEGQGVDMALTPTCEQLLAPDAYDGSVQTFGGCDADMHDLNMGPDPGSGPRVKLRDVCAGSCGSDNSVTKDDPINLNSFFEYDDLDTCHKVLINNWEPPNNSNITDTCNNPVSSDQVKLVKVNGEPYTIKDLCPIACTPPPPDTIIDYLVDPDVCVGSPDTIGNCNGLLTYAQDKLGISDGCSWDIEKTYKDAGQTLPDGSSITGTLKDNCCSVCGI
jgi:hypothetical protein